MRKGNIIQSSDIEELILQTTLIWDEAPMTHRYYFEALDLTLKDIDVQFQLNENVIPKFI